MPNFGLITEGPTDQIVIENILSGYFNDPDLEFNQIQPLRDETDKNRVENYGGWTRVLEYCGSDQFTQVFSSNEYVIIQIDTDRCEDIGFDVSKREGSRELTVSELVEKVKEKIVGLINPAVFAAYSDRILFAISVDTIECWLLPIYYSDVRRAKITGCLDALNRELPKKHGFTIKEKKFDYYDTASKAYLKNKVINSKFSENPSLKIFIDEVTQKHPL